MSNGLGTQMSVLGMGRSQGVWMCLGRTQGGHTCGHFRVTGNLSLLFSHNGEHCMPAPTVPFCKPVLSFQEKENLLFCPAIFHPLFSSWGVYSQVKTFFSGVPMRVISIGIHLTFLIVTFSFLYQGSSCVFLPLPLNLLFLN